MSAGVMPDMYRHTARKSTVSKTLKPSNVPLCNTPTTHYSSYNNDIDSKQETIFDAIQCNIKLEEDIPHQEEPFIILPDNETEHMIIEEDIEQTHEEILYEIMQQILNQIIQSSLDTILSCSDQIKGTFSIDTPDVHNVMDSIMNHLEENDNTELLFPTINNRIEENVNRSSDETIPMECDQQASKISSSHIDDDIIEIEATTNALNSDSCTCRCHKPISPLNDEYLLFEQALKKTRQEQQQERLLNNNRLIQTLKRQHEELINIYQQNKDQKSLNIRKIDREQQTLKLNLHDSQIQTDLIVHNNSKISSQQQKFIVIPTINSHTTNTNGPQTATRNHSAFSNSMQTPSSSTLQQIIPRLPANIVATTAVTSKKPTVAPKTAMVANSQSIPPLPPPLPPPPSTSTPAPHVVVDLTEEDEDDTSSRIPPQRTTPIRQTAASTHLPTPPPTAAPTATRIQPTNRPIRPNSIVANGQTFPLRPLPEHTPCDQSIGRPQLSITQENATVRLTWNLPLTPMESIQNYEIYAYKQNATVTTSDWKKIGMVKSMHLPMAVTLKEFQSNSHYAFAVRAVSITNNVGPFCEPKTIFTGNTPVQPLHTSQLLNVST